MELAPPVTLGELVKRRRLDAGLSQYALAAMIGVRQPSVCKWESGQDRPRLEHISRMASIFGGSLDERREFMALVLALADD
jgi:transcriptional regulator with XRE-family HTH domain